MNICLDIQSDYSHQELYKFLDADKLPDFVKQAEISTKESCANLPEDAFADRYHKAFPIDSAASTYVSNAYFMNKESALLERFGTGYMTEVKSRLEKASELFDIENQVKEYNSDLAVKNAKDYTESNVCTIVQDDQTYNLFPYKTAADVSHAAKDFANNIKEYPFHWRTVIAADFIKTAMSLDMDELPDLVCKYGGFFFPDTRIFTNELKRRMNKISNQTAKEEYTELITKSANLSSREHIFGYCNEAYMIEKKAGVYDNNRLSNQLGDIVDNTFTLDFEKLANLLDVVKIAGETYKIEDLKKISPTIYKEAFGFDIDPQSSEELRDILPTVPRSDTMLFRELSGIRPL